MSKLYEIRYLRAAEEDLEDILDYIVRDNPSAASPALDQLDHSISQLARNPRLGVVPRDDRLRNLGYRMLIVGDYLVFYVMKSKTVQIRRIIRGTRNYQFLL
jgi:toxin ParE1/3/4